MPHSPSTFLYAPPILSFWHFALLASCALISCSKEEGAPVAQPSPDVISISAAAPRAATSADFATSWNAFVDRVSKGEFSDPLGQYVSKNTYVANDGYKERPTRPKYTQEERDARLRTLGFVSGDANSNTAAKSYSYQFESSEGRGMNNLFTPAYPSTPFPGNEQGYVWDLKIVKDGRSPLQGYTIIPVDLNRGAGGQYIYLSFTRDPRFIQNASDEGENLQSGPVRGITSVNQRIGAGFTSYPANYTPTWAEWGCDSFPGFCFKEGDLNDGAGGRFIYGYQSKLENQGGPIEVGVLSGNGNISPPYGWQKVGVDLNDGAGGAYIWFCFKRR